MANTTGGSVTWNFDIDDSKLKAGLASARAEVAASAKDIDRAVSQSTSSIGNAFRNVGVAVSSFGENLGKAGEVVSSLGSRINRIALPATLAIGAGLGLVGRMAFKQVSQVQQATLALSAYEKNGKKVNQVLTSLLAYARSDLGVLFNRKDLFAAAQGLKIMGDKTEDLTGHVKIMSRSVGLGLSTWEELTQIVGRVGSTGRLTGIDFDNLTKAGFKLNTNLRNTNITFAELFKAMDKGIPVDAMKGQANSIVGIGVRLQTAFRDIGNAILGVDSDTNKFVKGGAGDRLVKFLGELPKILGKPEIQAAFKRIGDAVATFFENAVPKIITFITFVGSHIDVILKLAVGLLTLGTAFKIVGGIIQGFGNIFEGVGMLLEGNPIALILTVIAVAALIIYKNWDKLKGVIDSTNFGSVIAQLNQWASITTEVVSGIVNGIGPALKAAWDWFNKLGPVIQLLISPLAFLFASFDLIKGVVMAVANIFMTWFWPTLKAIALTIWNELFPALKQLWDAVVRLWQALNPALITTLKIVGVIIGVALVGAIWLGLNILNVLIKVFGYVISAISNVIKWVSNLISWMGNLIGKVVNVVAAIGGWFGKLPGYVGSAVGGVIRWFSSLPGKILSALGNLGSLLFDAGKAVLTGFLNGIKSAWDAVAGFVGKIAGWIADLKGPLDYDRKLLIPHGKAMLQGFNKGLINEFANTKRLVSNMGLALSGTISPTSTQVIPNSNVSEVVLGASGSSNATNNYISAVNISNEVDGEYWLARLTRDDEITSKGLVNG